MRVNIDCQFTYSQQKLHYTDISEQWHEDNCFSVVHPKTIFRNITYVAVFGTMKCFFFKERQTYYNAQGTKSNCSANKGVREPINNLVVVLFDFP